MHPFLRLPGIVVLAALLAIGTAAPAPATATLAAVLARTDYPLTVIVTATPAVAYVDGMAGVVFVVTVDPSVAYAGDADLLAFVLLHELGHVVLGHLEMQPPPADRMRDAWKKELAADAFAVRAMLLYGFDPLRAAAVLCCVSLRRRGASQRRSAPRAGESDGGTGIDCARRRAAGRRRVIAAHAARSRGAVRPVRSVCVNTRSRA